MINTILSDASGLQPIWLVVGIILALAIGIAGGFFLRVKIYEKSLKKTQELINKKIDDAH